MRKAVVLEPNFALAYMNLGSTYASAGQLDEAMANLNKGISLLDPNDAFSYNTMGEAYAALGQYQEAIKNYEKAIAMNPKVLLNYAALANIYSIKLNEHDKAIMYLQKALEIDPNFAELYFDLGSVYIMLGQLEKGKENLRKAEELYKREGRDKWAKEARGILERIA